MGKSKKMSDGTETEIIQFPSVLNPRGQKLRVWAATVPENLKAVLVVVHGVAGHIGLFESLAVLLAQYGIHMCGYDQVGHGMSEGTRVDIKDFDHYVEDLIHYVNLKKKEHAGIPFFIMGHSMGGLVLGCALLKAPDLCKGSIFYAAAIDTNPEVFTPFKILMARTLSCIAPLCPVGSIEVDQLTRNPSEVKTISLWDSTILSLHLLTFYSYRKMFPTEEVVRLKEDPLRYQGGMRARWGMKSLDALLEFNERMNEIESPILICHGDDDKICRVEGSQKFYESAKSADKEIKVYKDGYHRLHNEPDGMAEQFTEDVANWIVKHIE